jgi:hypothetical protein
MPSELTARTGSEEGANGGNLNRPPRGGSIAAPRTIPVRGSAPCAQLTRRFWRRRPDLNRGWRFCRLSRNGYVVDSSCFLVSAKPLFYPVFGPFWTQVGPKFGRRSFLGLAARIRVKFRPATQIRPLRAVVCLRIGVRGSNRNRAPTEFRRISGSIPSHAAASSPVPQRSRGAARRSASHDAFPRSRAHRSQADRTCPSPRS